MRVLTAVAVTASVAAAALTFTAAPGKTAPYVQAPTLSVSASGPCKGTPLTVEGTGFVPGSAVGLSLRPSSASLGSAVASATGDLTKTVTLPDAAGIYQLVAAGPPTPKNSNTAEATLRIRDCAGPIPITGYTGSPAGGRDYLLPASLAALACLILGGGLLWWRRNRKPAA